MKYYLGLILLVLLGTSCFKKDDAVKLPPGYTEISTFSMGDKDDPYSKQIYFDLSSNQYSSKELADWDLKFETSDKGFGVFINGGNEIKTCIPEYYNLTEPITSDTAYIYERINNINFEAVDNGNGKAEESAIGDWRKNIIPSGTGDSLHIIYPIQLRYLTGMDRYRRLQIFDVNDSFFLCKFSKMFENNPPLVKIYKNKNQNFTYYSFKNGGKVVDNIEPPKDQWDLEFTRYRAHLNPPTPIPYSITGVLSNPTNVKVCMDTKNKFDDIDANYVSGYNFSTNRDVIGYDNWKTFDYINGGKGRYTMHPEITYIIMDTDGKFYKLRFLDFYDKYDNRGNPKFEFIRIK